MPLQSINNRVHRDEMEMQSRRRFNWLCFSTSVERISSIFCGASPACGLRNEVGELVDDERALVRVLVFRQAPLAVDHELDRHRAAHRFPGGRGDGTRLVIDLIINIYYY